jgi:hypothetical protein
LFVEAAIYRQLSGAMSALPSNNHSFAGRGAEFFVGSYPTAAGPSAKSMLEGRSATHLKTMRLLVILLDTRCQMGKINEYLFTVMNIHS